MESFFLFAAESVSQRKEGEYRENAERAENRCQPEMGGKAIHITRGIDESGEKGQPGESEEQARGAFFVALGDTVMDRLDPCAALLHVGQKLIDMENAIHIGVNILM